MSAARPNAVQRAWGAIDERFQLSNLVAFLAHKEVPVGAHSIVTQFYARENMNLPFSVRLNTDPDLAVGIKTTISLGGR